MVYPDSWKEFVESGEFDKIQNILKSDGWKLFPSIDSGVVVIDPKRIESDQSDDKR